MNIHSGKITNSGKMHAYGREETRVRRHLFLHQLVLHLNQRSIIIVLKIKKIYQKIVGIDYTQTKAFCCYIVIEKGES